MPDPTFRYLHLFVEELRKHPVLTDSSLRLLNEIFYGLRSRRVYEAWREAQWFSLGFDEPNWTDADHEEKFREYAIAAFLELLRPGDIGWRGTPNLRHMELVGEFAGLFFKAPGGVQRAAIRSWWEGAKLEAVVKSLKPRRLPYPKIVLAKALLYRDLPPREFAERMNDVLKQYGIKLSSKDGSRRKQIQRLKQKAKDREPELRKLF